MARPISLKFEVNGFGPDPCGGTPRAGIPSEGLNVGLDRAEPVTADYPGESPWAFTGGTIHKVVVDVSGDPWVDLQKEAEAAFARD